MGFLQHFKKTGELKDWKYSGRQGLEKNQGTDER